MKLEDWLRKNGIKKNFFAEELGVTYRTLLNIFKTDECNKTIALAIENLTKREVSRPIDLIVRGKK
jgi:hypothetical protein